MVAGAVCGARGVPGEIRGSHAEAHSFALPATPRHCSLNEAESARQCGPCVSVRPETREVVAGTAAERGGPKPFTFDAVFGPDSTQEAVYDAAVQSLVAQFMAGYNATVLAYGQTGR
jgi:hypothetical protein